MSLIGFLELLSGSNKKKNANQKPKRKTSAEKEMEKLQKERKLWEMAEEYEQEEQKVFLTEKRLSFWEKSISYMTSVRAAAL